MHETLRSLREDEKFWTEYYDGLSLNGGANNSEGYACLQELFATRRRIEMILNCYPENTFEHFMEYGEVA